MTYTVETLHVGNGVTTQFGLTFTYLDSSHIRVSVNGVVVGHTLVSPAVVRVNPAPAAGSQVRVYRETPIASLNHSFQLGAPFLPAYVDANNLQSLYGVQESRNLSEKAVAAAGSAASAAGVANSTANNALSIANAATSTANTASSTANNANAAAQAATVTANKANATANAAVATADTASAAASAAVGTANAASSAASSAVATANAATSSANNASVAAQAANVTANAASTTANNALATANSAVTTANSAAATANAVSSAVSSAVSTANAASAAAAAATDTASTALSTANTASTNADTALTTANGLDAKATEALSTANAASLKADEALAAVSGGGVSSWNGRSGTVTPQAGDYTAAQVSRGASNVDAAISALEAGKADSAHSHTISAVTGLQAALDGKQGTLVSGTTIKTVNGVSLLGSGDLTLAGGTDAVSSVNGQVGVVVLSAADVGAAEATHTHTIGDVTALQAALDTKANIASIASTVRTTPLSTLSVDTSPATAITKSDSVIKAFGKLQAQIDAGAGGTGGVALGDTAAVAPGTASAGTASTAARSDHVHPAQTTITGNAGTATKLATARTISLTGDVTGSVTFDGSANAAITATVADGSHNHIISNVDGLQGALDGKQATLVSGTNIKTINGVSILGSGDLTISGSGGNAAITSVKDYGAVGDGVTNDAAAIQAAINNSNSVYFPAGIYVCKASITVPANVAISGAGVGATKIIKDVTTVASAGLFSINSNSSSATLDNISFKDMTISEKATTFSEHQHLISLNGVNKVTIQNVNFEGFVGDGIYIGQWTSPTLTRINKNVSITNCTFNGINKYNRNAISVITGSDIHISNCVFENVTSANMPGAVDFEPNGASGTEVISNCSVTNCTFRNVGGNVGAVAVFIPSAAVAAVGSITIANNSFSSVNTAIAVINKKPSSEMTVSIVGNSASLCTRPVNLGGRVTNVSVVSNSFYASDTALIGYAPTDVVQYTYVTNNVFANTGSNAFGVAVAGAVSDLTISHNQFRNNYDYGVLLGLNASDSFARVSFNDNTAISMRGAAYLLHHSSGSIAGAGCKYYRNSGAPNYSKFWLTDDVGTVVNAGTAVSFNSSTLPDSFAVGVSVSVVNGDTGVPDVGGYQGTLVTHKAIASSAYANFTYQEYIPANNTIKIGSKYIRKRSQGANSWSAWFEVNGV